MDTTLEVFIIVILMGLSAIYSGMETALVTLSDVKLRRRIEESKKPSRVLTLWRDSPNDVITTLLIGNNLVNITSSALATDLTNTLLGDTGWGIPIAVGAMTLLVLIFGEVVPKTFAKNNPERYLVFTPLVRASHAVFYPAMRVLVGLTEKVVQSLGGEIQTGAPVTEEDIEELVRIGKTDGSMSPVATKLLTGIFDLDDKLAREAMVPRTDVVALRRDATVDEVLDVVRESGYSRYPVYGDNIDDIVGVLYVKDLLTQLLDKSQQGPPNIGELMRKPLVRAWNSRIQDLLVEMQRERVHLVVLASEYGGVAGIITLEDIVEEVFGPIYDEHDTSDEESIRHDVDGSLVIDGVLPVGDLEEELGIEFPEDEDYETVAGLLMKEASTFPEQGFTCEIHGLRFEVLKADATRVLEVSVRRVTAVDAAPQDGAVVDTAPTAKAGGAA
ncbi:MAG: HlyC/CorC family transporter [Deltaproteobacteria bacterium]|nr:HlyC/CorC family transporter [Deltaproteobacteria bacterium]